MRNLTKQLYKDLESMHKTTGIADSSIFPSIALMIALISNPYAIPYSLAIKILRITRLYFIKD